MVDIKKPTFAEALESGQTLWVLRFKGYRKAGAIRSHGVQEALILARDEDHANEVGKAWLNTFAVPGAIPLAVMPALVADESILSPEAKARLAATAAMRRENERKAAQADQADTVGAKQ